MIKRLSLLVSLLWIAAAVMTGCKKAEPIDTAISPAASAQAGSIPATHAPPQPIKLTLRHSLIKDISTNQLKALQAAVTNTEFEVPELNIELEGVDENFNRSSRLKAEMAAGNPPQIFELFGGEAEALTYARAGQLLDLTGILEELEKQYDFANLQNFTYDGKIYGLPITGHASGIFYNKRIFADLGLQPPANYREFLDICEQVKASGLTPLALASGDAWVPPLLLNSLLVHNAGVGEVAGFRTRETKWTDPVVMEAFVHYEELVAKGYFSVEHQSLSYSDQQNQFKAGKAAMLFDGSWAYSSLIDAETSTIANSIGFFAFPDVGGAGDGLISGSFTQGYGFSANMSEAQIAAVKIFIGNLYNDKMQKKQLAEDGIFPSMFLLDNTDVPPLVTDIITTVKYAAGTFAPLETQVQKQVYAVLEEGLQQLLAGKTTALQLIEQLQAAQDMANAN